MRFPAALRPRSLTGLLLLAFSAVALPLLYGSISAAVQIRDLGTASEQLVANGVRATQFTQAIVRQVASMERAARLYQILGRPALLDAYLQNGRILEATLAGLERLPGDPRRAEEIGRMRASVERVTRALTSGSERRVSAALRDFPVLSRSAGALSQLAGQQTDDELRQLRAATERVRRRLYWQATALIPVTVGLVLLFAGSLARPIRQIDRAIANIGHGRLAQPVEVKGTTDLEALGRQLEWLRRRLVEIAEERNRFLRHMSHELKTPLANIREGAELLTEGAVGPLGAEQREIVGILRENSLQLQRLIENLLSFSEWQARRGGVEISEFRLQPLVQATLEHHQLAIAGRRLQVESQLADLTLRADRAKLRLIVENLVSNAVKHTPEGGTITLRAGERDGELLLEVADTGPGIAAADREHVFEAFYQGAAPAPGGLLRGTGIGLSVVKEFVLAQGGRVEIVDGEFPGAHFRVSLPMIVESNGLQSAQ